MGLLRRRRAVPFRRLTESRPSNGLPRDSSMASLVPTPSILETRRAQMFPVLEENQIARIARVGTEQTLDDGTLLFDEGESGLPFYVVLGGEGEVVHPAGKVEEPVVVHTAGQFTGEITLLTKGRT